MPIRILAVVVLYNERFINSSIFGSLLFHRPDIDVFIWDNSLESQSLFDVGRTNITYVHCSENRGISYAYNRAFEYACENSYSWMLLLDQDTNFSKDYLLALEQNIVKYPDIKLFCPVHQLSNGLFLSPVRCFCKFSHTSIRKVVGKLILKKYAIINSGLLVDVALFRSIGGYNERAFLDYSDFQFIERVSKKCKYAVCVDSVCVQNFSNDIRDLNKLVRRFELFCNSLKGCDKSSLLDYVIYFLIVSKRGISLAFRLKSLKPFKVIFSCYILN